jgi:predicted RNA-binding protein YlqC (UPF0109 family)
MTVGDGYEPGDVNASDDELEAVDGEVELDYEPGDVNTVEGAAEDWDDDEIAEDGNRATSSTAADVLTYIARALADEPGAVVVRTEERRSAVRLQIHVAPDDMGRLIGRRGRTAQAVRTLVAVAGARDGVQTSVDIVDD